MFRETPYPLDVAFFGAGEHGRVDNLVLKLHYGLSSRNSHVKARASIASGI